MNVETCCIKCLLFQAQSRSQMKMIIYIMINLKIQHLFLLVVEALKALTTVAVKTVIIVVATKFAFTFAGK